MEKIISPGPDDMKLYRDHFYTLDWTVARANQDFICEYSDCQTQIKYSELFISQDDENRKKDYCIKHGLQKLRGQYSTSINFS